MSLNIEQTFEKLIKSSLKCIEKIETSEKVEHEVVTALARLVKTTSDVVKDLQTFQEFKKAEEERNKPITQGVTSDTETPQITLNDMIGFTGSPEDLQRLMKKIKEEKQALAGV